MTEAVAAVPTASDSATREIRKHHVISSELFARTVPEPRDWSKWKGMFCVGVESGEEEGRDVRIIPTYKTTLFLVVDTDEAPRGTVLVMRELVGRKFDPKGKTVICRLRGRKYPSHVTIHGQMQEVKGYDWVSESAPKL